MLHNRYITVTSPLHYRYAAFPLWRFYITVTWPLPGRYMALTLLLRCRYVTVIGGQESRPGGRLPPRAQQWQGWRTERLPPTRAHSRWATDGLAARLGTRLGRSMHVACMLHAACVVNRCRILI